MRLGHFNALAPLCPVCREGEAGGSRLRLAKVISEQAGHVLEGVLHCTNTNCLREYPIIDGVPLIVANLRQYVAQNILAVQRRRDTSEFMESILGDCCGPNSAYENTRQQLSSYTWDHYADLDPTETEAELKPGSMLRTMVAGLEATKADATPLSGHDGSNTTADVPGPALDLGCAVGRSTFALAERTGRLVLGVDLNFPMVRLAAEVLRTGKVRYSRRRTGLVYERREFAVKFRHAEQVDFWACDALALPFAPGTFDLAANMNLLDSVSAPRELLVALGRMLAPGGRAVLACPYDWSASATPVEAWLGGHSQRSASGGACDALLRALLTPNAHPGSINTLRLIAEHDDLPWHVRLHERSTVVYRLHLVVAERLAAA